MQTDEPDVRQALRKKASIAFAIFVVLMIVASIPFFIHQSTVSAARWTALVTITPTGMSPSTIRVGTGTEVTWVNDDSSTHWIASDPYPTDDGLPGLNSLNALNRGDSYSYIFTKPGTFTYHDQLHPYAVTGTIIVHS